MHIGVRLYCFLCRLISFLLRCISLIFSPSASTSFQCSHIRLQMQISLLLSLSYALPVTSMIKRHNIQFGSVFCQHTNRNECVRKVHISRGFAICFSSRVFKCTCFCAEFSNANQFRWCEALWVSNWRAGWQKYETKQFAIFNSCHMGRPNTLTPHTSTANLLQTVHTSSALLSIWGFSRSTNCTIESKSVK